MSFLILLLISSPKILKRKEVIARSFSFVWYVRRTGGKVESRIIFAGLGLTRGLRGGGVVVGGRRRSILRSRRRRETGNERSGSFALCCSLLCVLTILFGMRMDIMLPPSSEISTSSSLSSSSDEGRAGHHRISSDRLRTNLMIKLGLETIKRNSLSSHSAQCIIKNREPPYTRSLLGKVNIHTEKLKYKRDQEQSSSSKSDHQGIWGLGPFFKKEKAASADVPVLEAASESSAVSMTSEESSSSPSASIASRKRPPVSFNEDVLICPIPKKEEYSKRIKERIWASHEELMLNAHRNSIEFASENWDWRRTPDDDQMYRCIATNELIHPVHIHSQHVQELLGGSQHLGIIGGPQQQR